MDKAKEFLEDLKQNWDNSYWWADHQWLMYVGLLLIYWIFIMGIEASRIYMRTKMEGSL